MRLIGSVGLLAVAGCGGGGGTSGSGDTPPVVATPTPSPTPTPTPSPVVSTARVYGPSAATGRLDFSADGTQGAILTQGFTSRDGRYFPRYLNAIFGYVGVGAGGNGQVDNSDRYKFAVVIDHETAMILSLAGGEATKMVTPVTALLKQPGSDQNKLKTQLGLRGSLFGMVADPDLLTYDAVDEAASGDGARVADAARMSAATVRALAIGAGFDAIGGDTTPSTTGFAVGGNLGDALSACLRDAAPAFIFTNERMTALAECFYRGPRSLPRARTLQAIAHLINAYAAAIPVRLESRDDKARWLLGIRGYLAPAIAQLSASDDDAAVQLALSTTVQTILNETARYVDHYTYSSAGLFNPGPDFLTLASGTSQSIAFSRTLRVNDIQIGAPNGGFLSGGTLMSINVPAANEGEISAVRDGDTIVVAVRPGFRGVSWFDYVTRSDEGEQRTARVYVRAF